MSVKKDWISAAIILMICMCGWCTCGRAARINRRNIRFDNQSKQTVDLSALTLNTTFSDAIDILRNSTEPPLKIVVLWRDLRENAGVEQDTPIYIDGVSGIRLRTGLKILLRSVSSGLAELDYVVDKGIIIVGTKDSLPAKKVVRIYDISYLVGRPATFGFNFGAGFARGWPMRANWGGIGPGTVRGGRGWRTYGPSVRRGTRRGAITIWGQSYGLLAESGRVREQNEIPQLIKHTIRPNSWR
ncbi:MAG: hypothetical protein ACYS6W_17065 [Planctomycetota bacterium]|jgi:hypothetical protein